MDTVTLRRDREKLERAAQEVSRNPKLVVRVVGEGQNLAVLSWEANESMRETLEVQSDPEAIRRSLEDIKAGRMRSRDEAMDELGW